VLLIAPPPVSVLTELAEMLAGAEEKSRRFAHYYKGRAERYGVAFFDAGSVIRCSELDGIHFEQAEHATLGRALADVVKTLIG
jgi:hypothetical protein